LAVFSNWESFRDYVQNGGDSKPVLGVFYPEQFPYYADGGRTLRLRDMVEAVATLLRARGKPFFLIIEAGLPDKASHLNNAKRAIVEVLELDATIEWLRKNPAQRYFSWPPPTTIPEDFPSTARLRQCGFAAMPCSEPIRLPGPATSPGRAGQARTGKQRSDEHVLSRGRENRCALLKN
jgi:hypothetical protein